MLGTIVVLSGPSRAGKSTIAARIQDAFAGIWVLAWLHLDTTERPEFVYVTFGSGGAIRA